jgi:hypothetical protein
MTSAPTPLTMTRDDPSSSSPKEKDRLKECEECLQKTCEIAMCPLVWPLQCCFYIWFICCCRVPGEEPKCRCECHLC